MSEVKVVKAKGTKIHTALHAITRDIGSIGKNHEISFGERFRYRGIDDLMAALQPLLVEHGVVILPRMVNVEREARETAKGGFTCLVELCVQYEFVCVEDGSSVVVSGIGHGQDASDKGSGKAASNAFKTLMFQMFCVPTDSAQDVEATNHGATTRRAAPARKSPPSAGTPQGSKRQAGGGAPPPATGPSLADVKRELGEAVNKRIAALGLSPEPGIRAAVGKDALASVGNTALDDVPPSKIPALFAAIDAWEPQQSLDSSGATPEQAKMRAKLFAQADTLHPTKSSEEKRALLYELAGAEGYEHLHDVPEGEVYNRIVAELKERAA